MSEPKVSVVVCIYNGEKFIRQTINSILNQTYQNLQIILLDDASTDASRSILDTYTDPRIVRMNHKENCNVCVSSNLAFQRIEGKYVAIVGHDDLWAKNKIEKQVAFMEHSKESAVCFTWSKIIDEQGRELADTSDIRYQIFHSKNVNRLKAVENLFFQGNFYCASSALIRKECLDEMDGFQNGLVQFQDYDLWLRISSKYDMRILEEELTSYRIFPSGEHQSLDANTIASVIRKGHEEAILKYMFLERIEDDDFLECFTDWFHRKKIEINKEIIPCAKAYLLLEVENPYVNLYFSKMLNKESFQKSMKSIFGWDIKRFYEWNGKPIMFDDYAQMEMDRLNSIAKQQSILLEKQNAKIKQQQKLIEQQQKMIAEAQTLIEQIEPLLHKQ